MKTALSIAGSDSSGGAGIQADIKTMTMHGVFAMTAVTALTAQNTTGVRAVLESTPEFLGQQLDAVFEDIRPDAVKIGMVSSPELVRMIAQKLRQYGAKHIVVDPVLVATSGSALAAEGAAALIRELLFPLAQVVTPNIPEAEAFSGMTIRSRSDMEKAAEYIGGRAAVPFCARAATASATRAICFMRTARLPGSRESALTTRTPMGRAARSRALLHRTSRRAAISKRQLSGRKRTFRRHWRPCSISGTAPGR